MRGTHHASGIALAFADQLAVAVFGHPVRAGEVSVMDGPAMLGVMFGIEAKENLHSFAPIGAITLGIEQAHVEFHMLAIIGRQRLAGRWLVEESLCRASHHSLTFG
ncbi:hypothetical protein ADZ37_22305 [Pannonibacter phragmitetus]|uniref:Uncharacterized protein n=1 Tax=Pannonibacter phragmitetus TaxID=121719 RepID=A0A0L0ITQ6_9HYPH|nr:hypothetical protein APZ00_10655 [Pannonibacter phragmitetus]KND16599.1 hypothetical protein ADZ37_22305 [Pannonibacter phragmitetus]